MKTSHLVLLALAGVGVAVVALLSLDSAGTGAPGAPWDFPPGSWVRFHDVDTQGSRTVETDEQWTVLELGADMAGVEIRRTGQGFIPAVERLNIGLREEVDSVRGATWSGRGAVTIAGDALDCEIWERTGADSTTKLWIHPRSKWPVKVVLERRGTTPETVEREWLGTMDTVRIADEDLACDRFREVRRLNAQVVEETELWRHPGIPGHFARRTQRIFEKDGEARVRTEATGFGIGGSGKR